MTVSTKDFLTHAKNLLQHQTGEIELRNSIRNAYYGAYHEAHTILTSPIIHYANMGIHKAFITYIQEDAYRFESSINKQVFNRLAIILAQLKLQRQNADYRLDKNILLEDANVQMKQAENVFVVCSAIKDTKSLL